MYRDLMYDASKSAVTTVAGTTVVSNVTEEEAFALMNRTGELERVLNQQNATSDGIARPA